MPMNDQSSVSDKKIIEYDMGDSVASFFVVRKKYLREYAKGTFITFELGDSSGRIQAVLWEPDQFCLNELEEGMIVKIQGQVGEYNNKRQLTINRIRLALEDEYAIENILAHSIHTEEERKSRILNLTEKIENSYIKQLAELFWSDEQFFKKYLTAPAGKLWHHAYIGGLSEHSANVTELALRIAQSYSFIKRDYLIFGGLFHDAGKIDTYKADGTIDYTDEGRLINHICLADEWVSNRSRQIDGFPAKLLMKLRHMILSHQGELEYATPVVPQIPEAFILYYSDEIDSKMGAIDRIRSRQKEPGWSEFIKLLDRFIYFEDIPGENKSIK